MRRAAVSISSNIAEGHSAWKRQRFINHGAIARGSLAELEAQMILATRFGDLTSGDTAEFWQLAGNVGRLLSKLRLSLGKAPGEGGQR